MEEIWEDIKGYQDYYQVSNFGNVRSKDRVITTGIGSFLMKSKVLKIKPNSRGYMRIMLKVDGNGSRRFVHRLVADAFCEKKEGCNIVNHLDSNFLNNRYDNLEWTTFKGNSQHALKNGRLDRTSEWLLNQRASLVKYDKPVFGTNIITNEKVYFCSIQEAGRNGFLASSVCNCCQGKAYTHKGYTWTYAQDLGIDVMTPTEIERMKSLWGKEM